MTEETTKKASLGTPIKSLLSSDLADDEVTRWASFVFASTSKRGDLTNIRQDMDYILSKRSIMKFHPLWFAPNRLMSGYICHDNMGFTLEIDGGNGIRDLLTLHATINALEKMIERKQQALMIVPLHASTLYERQTRELFRHYCELRALPVHRHLVFMLSGLEGRHHIASDIEHIRSASNLCRSFILNMHAKDLNIAKYSGIRPHACGLSADLFNPNDTTLFDMLPKFAESCEKFGVKSFLTDIRSTSIMSAAIAAGFSYLEGDAILSAEDAPKHAEFLGMESVYQHTLGQDTEE